MTHTVPPLATERLLLRPLALDDADEIREKFAQWQVVRFLDAKVPWPYPRDGVLHYIRDVALPEMARGDSWHWSIRSRTNPSPLIGVISLRDNDDDNRGFWIDPAFQGRRFAIEAADVVTDFWFGSLGKGKLLVAKASSNAASQRISGTARMLVLRTLRKRYVSGVAATELWELSREDWLARRTR